MNQTLYQTHKKSDEELIASFSLRTKEFEEIKNKLHRQGKTSLQHYLITGKRGMGKSTLLKRISIETEQHLTHKLIPIYLGSEQYRISKLFKLWEACLEHLIPLNPELRVHRDKIKISSEYDLEVLQVVLNFAKANGKTILLFIDNFDSILKSFTKREAHRLREILIEYPIQIIGNCLFYDEKFISYDAPFYDFFQRIPLNRLSREESLEFFKTMALEEVVDFDKLYTEKKAQIETLMILCGGVPRTAAILFEIIIHQQFETSIEYLKYTIDQVTPLYQSRMEHLAPLQKEIMYHMAIIWDRCAVSDLKDKTGLNANAIAGQLKILEDNGYISSYDLEGFERLKYYEIEERFFNIWLLMSESPLYDSQRVLWLTRWLEAFYSSTELVELTNKILQDQGIKVENKFMLIQAIEASNKLAEPERRYIIKNTYAKLNNQIPELLKKWIVDKIRSNDISDLNKNLNELIDKEKYDEIIELIPSILKNQEKVNDESYHATLYYILGLSFTKIGKIAEAEKYYNEAIEKGDIDALNSLANLYSNNGRTEEAEKYYKEAIVKGEFYSLNNLAILYSDHGRTNEAEKYYKLAIEKGDSLAILNLPIFYYRNFDSETNENFKLKALNHIMNYSNEEIDDPRKIVFSAILLWNLEFDKAEENVRHSFKSKSEVENMNEIISIALNSFLVFKQYQVLYSLFQDFPKLKESHKPIYYCLLSEIKKQEPKLWQRMPSELKQPVEDLKKYITSEQVRLGVIT